MPDLMNYGLYLDAREGASVWELANDYGLSIEDVKLRLEAARLCFERQVARVEFLTAQ
jgi:hypothetical protein